MREAVTPRELCDNHNAVHKQVYDWLQVRQVLAGLSFTLTLAAHKLASLALTTLGEPTHRSI